MTSKDIYNLVVRLGMESDLRGIDRVKKYLAKAREKFSQLPADLQAEYDQEKLTNPYSDTRLLVDNNRGEIKKIMVGIDIGGAELMLADKIGDIDLVISHHPDGAALAGLHEVMDLQARVLADYGVPINVAESILFPYINEIKRVISPLNHDRTPDFARALKLDYLCTHTVADNLSAKFVTDLIKKHETGLETVGDVIKLLKTIPEYKEAMKIKAGPCIFTGQADASCGKVVATEFTGGTNGAKEIYEKMSQAGIGTIISMHMTEEYRKEAKKHHLNVIIAGHIASDSLGMNLFLDEVENFGVQIVPIAGLTRIKRK